MKERPILFSSAMVCAILAGRKTQTRRIINPQPYDDRGVIYYPNHEAANWRAYDGWGHFQRGFLADFGRWAAGDRLWVRETWATKGEQVVAYRADGRRYGICPDGDGGRLFIPHETLFMADKGPLLPPGFDKWRPSIFLPRWASRITLDVEAVRVERLHAITEEDARAEGVESLGHIADHDCERFVGLLDTDARGPYFAAARDAFRAGWDTINGKRAAWASNPWVTVTTFGRADV